jgi:hypothetical protein
MLQLVGGQSGFKGGFHGLDLCNDTLDAFAIALVRHTFAPARCATVCQDATDNIRFGFCTTGNRETPGNRETFHTCLHCAIHGQISCLPQKLAQLSTFGVYLLSTLA